MSINGTVGSEFSGLSQAAVNPFSNSPFANYSLYGSNVSITANSFSAPGVVYAQNNVTVQESPYFGNNFLNISDAKFNSNMLSFSGTTLNFNGNIQLTFKDLSSEHSPASMPPAAISISTVLSKAPVANLFSIQAIPTT